MPQTLRDEHGRTVQLGRKLHEGGEGFIWEIIGVPDALAKTYKKDDPEKAEKLRVMPSLSSSDVLRVAAWPHRLLYDTASQRLLGFAMERVPDHQEIHQLYSPHSRRAHFPDANWDFLIHVAMNCAAAFETVHAANQVIGDVNQSGILVSKKGTVRLIDCDSFQVQSNGRVYYCVVGVPIFTPPELQSVSNFRGIMRIPNHDNFGLALLIFHLLFMGRHPFAGKFSGAGDMPIERAIVEGRFAFSSKALSYQMSPPPHAIGLNTLPLATGAMFERAFTIQNQNTLRPTAREWLHALVALKSSLVKCQEDKAHLFPRHLSDCPWCKIEEAGGPAFFMAASTSIEFDATFDLIKVWREIEQVGAPPGSDAISLTNARNVTFAGKSLSPETRFDLIPFPDDIGKPPVLIEQLLPSIPPYRSVSETIQSDPPYVPLSRPHEPQPILPPPPVEPSHPITISRTVPIDRQELIDYRICAWTTILTGVAECVIVFFQPIAAAFTSMLPIAFAIAWLILSTKRRHVRRQHVEWVDSKNLSLEAEYKNAHAKFSVMRSKWEAVCEKLKADWLRSCDEANVAWEKAEATNRLSWQNLLQQLAKQRDEAPGKEAAHWEQWERERDVIVNTREEIEVRNRWTKAQWTIANDKYQTAAAKAIQIKQQIVVAKGRFDSELRSRQQRRDEAAADLEAIRSLWVPDSLRYVGELRTLRQSLERMKQQYEDLRREFSIELARRQTNQREAQFRDFLDQILIADESIPNFKKNRKALLAANGIETALDVSDQSLDRLQGHGFGERLKSQLLAWRREQERRFVFNISKGMPVGEIRSLQAQFHPRRQTLQRTLRGGREQAEAIQVKAKKRLDELQRRANEVVATLAQADADLSVCLNILRSWSGH